MVLRFDSNGLLWFFQIFPGRKNGVQQNISVVWQSSRLKTSLVRVPRFSKIINFRLCRIGKETFSAKTSVWSTGPGWSSSEGFFLVSSFPRNQPRGRDLFWIYALDFRRVFACFVHEGLYRILFKLLMNGGRLVWVPRPLQPNGSRSKEPENERDGRVVDVRNNFSYARSGTSFQWWTRRRWLVRKLKICKFSLVSKICYFFGSLSCVSCFLDGWKGGTLGDAESIFLHSKVGWIFLFCLVWWLEVTSLFWILNNFCFGICCFWRGRVARFRQGF